MNMLSSIIPVGSICSDDAVSFVVWGPFLSDCAIHIYEPEDLTIPMEKDSRGYWRGLLKTHEKKNRIRYKYRINKLKEYPDPASRYQPYGVHDRSEVIDFSAIKKCEITEKRPALDDYVIYELHVGTFTPQGTFEAIIPRLPVLKELGINALELMPISQFPGKRNWGYDGVYPFAVQNSYGGPWGLRKLVDSCHQIGMAVVLDVVYNHLGPEGNYLSQFAPYFTQKYKTPWGEAINYDDAFSDEVRNFFIYNALFWFSEYDIDALRLDAIHAIYDESAYLFLEELADKTIEFCHTFNKTHFLIAESDRNDPKFIYPKTLGGCHLHGQWCDDFHHALHAFITKETKGYYSDFGSLSHVAKAFKQGYVIDGCYSSYRKRKHGRKPQHVKRSQLIVFSQNHDQIGNRYLGERLSCLIDFSELKMICVLTLLSGFIPLLFMGEEYGEKNPFLYFVDHGDPNLLEAVRKGRLKEFADFHGDKEGYDATKQEAFNKSIINWELRTEGTHAILWKLYQHTIALRKKYKSLICTENISPIVNFNEEEKLFFFLFNNKQESLLGITNFDSVERRYLIEEEVYPLGKILDLADEKWSGPGSISPDQLFASSTSIPISPKNIVLYYGC
ncbi:malto-oligosyltrehalose trehalohydrolase [Candidatus Methylacidiphilum fumarolicum]|uniref:Malto-oligosyltrehalose trehalohydrolase n=2 Tax=Candidatus Methylacidiphilum fumarolicum TaxID=591154 RepID=I0JWL2_METFB|nr:malto-oligosyltrehalose trehalohydrolase [Candidatus Methylacidiphilum fumarolicum]CCG91631.1 Malto-oligosyltrehalose trehalohydrolase [Methylacidiphilum fumariolicum SolV]MBW6415321.1 malto-oligosyltrehalose trehalohydrolase [Candidatus Methylacidiphilum fumarolicum]TFE68647.1 malto-oligosyltrehalose trehalohydrolase [Candidatus Methylacidiphilum fumarolicum]TFE72590.1 malto-oligosyltrehalose trehalohydrolase [Candidatus Methylacidiphilum fumarolicum]TFE73907.1 malto-oligosyltrehalose treh